MTDTETQREELDPAKLREELTDIISTEGLIDRAKLTPDATLETLNFASYDMVMILMAIEEKYSVYLPVDEGISDVKTFDDLLNVLSAKIIDQENNPIARPPDADAVEPAAATARPADAETAPAAGGAEPSKSGAESA